MADLIPPRRNEFLTKSGIPTTRFAEYLEELARSLNSSDESIELFATINAANAAISSLNERINSLESALDLSALYNIGDLFNFISDYTFYSVSANHTTSGNELIEATAELEITLNTSPRDLERVSVKRNGVGVVTISGSIDGDTEFKLLYNYESVDLIYTGSSWLII